jgi:hypothetical protein
MRVYLNYWRKAVFVNTDQSELVKDLLTVVKSMREMKKFIVLSKLEAVVRRNNIRQKAWSLSKLL